MTPGELGIYNFRRLSPSLTTSGQPDEAQLAELARRGTATIINLALVDSPRALADEAGTVAALGMRYVHIPVEYSAPTRADFDLFCDAMTRVGETPVHVHCAANYRVSAFIYRYRRERLGWSDAEARPDLDAIWQPDSVWQAFISQAETI